MALTPEERISIQEALLVWFKIYGRDFPWRNTRDPFKVLVAERLLQQTAARESVVSAYNEIVAEYPSPRALAQANPELLREIIAPLGLVYRTEQLIQMAQTIVDEYAGEVPSTLEQLLSLPGVGDYAARAVMSFCYGEDYPIVDTNVARFLYRVLAIPGKLPSNPARKRQLLDLAAELVPSGQSRSYNLALLDLCAQVCTPRKPSCTICPIQPWCAFGQNTTKLA